MKSSYFNTFYECDRGQDVSSPIFKEKDLLFVKELCKEEFNERNVCILIFKLRYNLFLNRFTKE